jgi:hypothetical protein
MSDAVPCRCHFVRLAEHGQEYDGGQFDATGRELPAFMQTPERIKDEDVLPAESHSCCWTMESGKVSSPVTGKCA